MPQINVAVALQRLYVDIDGDPIVGLSPCPSCTVIAAPDSTNPNSALLVAEVGLGVYQTADVTFDQLGYWMIHWGESTPGAGDDQDVQIEVTGAVVSVWTPITGGVPSLADLDAFIASQGIILGVENDATARAISLSAAVAYVQEATGKEYGLTTALQRIFDGSGTRDILIDHCQTVTVVQDVDVDGTLSSPYTPGDYLLWPYNEDTKYILRRGLGGSWPRGYRYAITALWGCGDPPADARDAIVKLATIYCLGGSNLPTISGSVAGAVKSYSTGVYSVTFGQATSDFVATMTGWGDQIERVLALHGAALPF